jgi:hypothetical protein
MGRAGQKFDQGLFTLKLSELSREMHIKGEASYRKRSAESRGTGRSVLMNIVDCKLALLRDEWLKGVDRIAREVWQIQGQAPTPDFVRDVLMPEAMTLIEVQKGVIKTSLERAQRFDLNTHPHPAHHLLATKIRRLTAEIANRYEIEARELEYKRARPSLNVLRSQIDEQKSTRGQFTRSDIWRNFHEAFMQLTNEEERIERAAPKDRLLRAYCDYKQHPEVWAEKGKPKQGPFCLLKAPGVGLWMLSDGVNENFQERFRALAAYAGVALSSPQGTDPEDFWLHRLYFDLIENNSDQLFAASTEGGVILRVCEASATFCSRLERKTITGMTFLSGDAAESHRKRQELIKTISGGFPNVVRKLDLPLAAAPEPIVGTVKGKSAAGIKRESPVGRNIDRLRKECGWSFDTLMGKTGIDKKNILAHVNEGRKPRPNTLKEYAQAFSRALQREITVADLEKTG